MAVTEDDIRYAYRFLLGREPDPREMVMWTGYPDLNALREAFRLSKEANLFRPAEDTRGSNVVNKTLVFDIGMSEGNDTDFYLKKGFHVIGVEADPLVCRSLETRFGQAIDDGRLVLLNRVVHYEDDCLVSFWKNEIHQGLSSTKHHDAPGYAQQQTEYWLKSINWPGLTSINGIPHYCKIDIEGGERNLLRSMRGCDPLPEYISAEIHEFSPIEELFILGYRKFKIIDQNVLSSFLPLPHPPLEGVYVDAPNWQQASGPFGRELLGDRWLAFDETAELFRTLKRLRLYRTVSWTWFDVHAWADLSLDEP